MTNLLGLYGVGYRDPRLTSDSQDYTTADVFGQMGANKRRAEYDNSLLGMVHNWATGEARQPVQLPDNAPIWDQAREAGARIANLPNDMAAGGAKTMAHWLGAAGNPEMVEPLDMLAPLGIGAMAGMAGHLKPSWFVGEKLSRDEASARALGRVGDQPAIADRDMLPFEPMYVPQAKRGPPLMGKNIPTVFDDYNGWGRIYANSANFSDDADLLRSRGASPMREAMNDAQDVPIDAYDRAALDRQWRQKVARTGELFADQSRASLPGLAANALDMSHEARMQRAREMGFDTDTTWFHGTNAKDFDAFDPGTRGATFFSDQPYLTDLFANPSRSSDGTSRVIPAYTKAKKLFDPSREADNPDLASYISENIRRYDVESILDSGKTRTKTPEEVLSELRGSKFDKDMFEPIEHPVIQEWIKRNGYDGFVVDDGSWMANAADKPSRVMGVFDPKNLRSPNAAFDPSKSDSANLLAADQARGSIPGLLAGAADEPTQDDELMRLLKLYGMMQ